VDEYKRAEFDGVPLIWVPHSGNNMIGGITFRTGTADEPFTHRGLTHLIEHLALSRLNVLYEFNGYVDALTTSFHAKGTPNEVANFVSQVCNALGILPYDRLETEINVLRAEGAQRGVSPYATSLSALFGAHHFGMLAIPEVGLEHATPTLLEEWRVQRFTRQNAIAWMAGPEPPAMSFAGLPQGERMAPAKPLRVLPNQPMVFHATTGGPSVINVTGRGIETQVIFAIAAQRLENRMRSEEGLSYSVQTHRDVVNSRYAVMGIFSDCTPENAEQARATMAAELHRMVLEGISKHEVNTFVDRMERALSDDNAAFGRAMSTAHNLIMGYNQLSEPELVQRARNTSSDDCVRILRPFLAGALWTVPQHVDVRDRRFTNLPAFSGTKASGPTAESIYSNHRLAVDADRLSVMDMQGNAVTMAFDDIIGAKHWLDGAWTFWNIEGFVLHLAPSDYPDGDELVSPFINDLDPNIIVRSQEVFRGDQALARLVPKEQPPAEKPAGLLAKLGSAE